MAEAKVEEELVVVRELPQQPINEAVDKDGKKYTLITIEEALTEILKSTREIKKSVA